MSLFNSRMGGTGYLSEVDVSIDQGRIKIEGLCVPQSWINTRLLVQWASILLGVALLFVFPRLAAVLIGFGVIWALVTYGVFWWYAKRHVVYITPHEASKAKIGRVFVWYNVFWLLVPFWGVVHFLLGMGGASRTVSFWAPGPTDPETDVRYILYAPDVAHASALLHSLLAGTLAQDSPLLQPQSGDWFS